MAIAGVLLILSGLAATPGRAWGPQGHRIIAHLAELRLDPAVRDTLERQFNIKHLAPVANWADEIKRQPGAPDVLHYTNIAEGERTYDRERDCPQGRCVTEKIPEFRGILADPARPRNERARALKFLVHLVADVHQPMHMGNEKDRGGNEIRVRHDHRETNLHALWDSELIVLGGRSLVQYARDLNASVTPEEARRWVADDVVAWTDESRDLVLKYGYNLLKDPDGRLSERYLRRGRVVIELQLMKAGVRLAHLLNQTLK